MTFIKNRERMRDYQEKLCAPPNEVMPSLFTPLALEFLRPMVLTHRGNAGMLEVVALPQPPQSKPLQTGAVWLQDPPTPVHPHRGDIRVQITKVPCSSPALWAPACQMPPPANAPHGQLAPPPLGEGPSLLSFLQVMRT